MVKFSCVVLEKGWCYCIKDKSLEDLISLVVKFRDDRNWKQFHNAKDLAISISLEASELLENFQWKTSEDLNNIKDELADIYIYIWIIIGG